MNLANLLDASSAAIVFGGTALATVLRCGLSDSLLALAALRPQRKRRFDAQKVRAELAAQIEDIRRDGLLRAPLHHSGDLEFDAATEALLGSRSVAALHAAHERHRAQRLERNNRAVRTWAQAAELAPVFGLAGTLISLSQLSSAGIVEGDYAAAISMAVLTTLYGLILANILLAPLGRLVERAGQAEERERQQIVDWLSEQVEAALPRRAPSPPRDPALYAIEAVQ